MILTSSRAHGITRLLGPPVHAQVATDPIALPDPPDGVPAHLPSPPTLSDLDAAWQDALDELATVWRIDVVPAWSDQLAAAVETALRDQNWDGLPTLRPDQGEAIDVTRAAMAELSLTAADQVADQAAQQGVEIAPAVPTDSDLLLTSTLVVGLLAAGIALGAVAEALRLWYPRADPEQVGAAAAEHVLLQSEQRVTVTLGWALNDAATAGRKRTYSGGPLGQVYATEKRDAAACKPCRDIDGRWLGTTHDMTVADMLYPTGGFVQCLGGIRCRGTIVARYEVTE